MNDTVLFEAQGIKKWFPVRKTFLDKKQEFVKAVDGINLKVKEGETLGIVGESGCGKSTLIKVLLQLLRPTEGKVFYSGVELTALSEKGLKEYRRNIQIVFQDPYAALNSRQRIADMLVEPFFIHKLVKNKSEALVEAKNLLNLVGLSEDALEKFPHEFSGGQRQRLCIARALAVKPKLLICDECVSALDVSIQAQIINLLMKLQREMGLTLIFVSHDLRVVRHISTNVAVMYLGKIVEYASKEEIFDSPKHPYTKALLSVVPEVDPDIEKTPIVLKGDIPSPINIPSGCSFRGRCWKVQEECSKLNIPICECGDTHWSSCAFPVE